MAALSFDTRNAPQPEDYTPITIGRHPAIIIESDVKKNNNATEQVELKWQITDGIDKGKTIMEWITVRCPKSEKAEEIGLRRFSGCLQSLGLAEIQMTEQLHNRPAVIIIKASKDGDPEHRDVSRSIMMTPDFRPIMAPTSSAPSAPMQQQSYAPATAPAPVYQTAPAPAPAPVQAAPVQAAPATAPVAPAPAQAVAPVQAAPVAPVQAAQAGGDPWDM